MAQPDLYKVLGVERGASEKEIKQAYRKLAREHHPDVNPGDQAAEERFKEISFAKEVLLTPEKRKLYDEFGHEGLASGFDPEQARAYQDWARRAKRSPGFEAFGAGSAGDENLEDLLSQLFGQQAGGAGFSGEWGGQSRRRRSSSRGADFEASLEVDFSDAIAGNEVQMRIEGREPLRVKLPRGARDGTRIRLKGQGQPAGPGAKPGDLYVRLVVRPHPFFRRDGDDLHLDVPVTIPELILGAEVRVPTPDGVTKVKVPPRSANGRTLRLPGKGVAKLGTKGVDAKDRGHLFLHLQAVLPSGSDPEVEELARKLERFYESQDPRAGLRWEER
jgi:DnaJ-class molecular chaperone